jgi:hypothetical protein
MNGRRSKKLRRLALRAARMHPDRLVSGHLEHRLYWAMKRAWTRGVRELTVMLPDGLRVDVNLRAA